MKLNKVTFSKEERKVPATLVILVLWIFIILFLRCCAACDQVDQDTLLSLEFKAASPLNWSVSSDCCLWEGIFCDLNGRVVHIWLPGRGLGGAVSQTIINLTYLSHLNLSHNSLFGTLPDGLFSSLLSLQVLDLSFNRLVDNLPLSSNATCKLQILNLSSNHFNGTILIPLVASGSLSIFNVSRNSFYGPIPVSFLCKNDSNQNSLTLTLLDLSFNKFNDSIPTGLGTCSKLQVFRAGFNDLSGHLPDDIFDLTDLQQLSLPVNRLTGPIGYGIVRLTNLKILELYSNQFLGPIPVNIGNLFKLEKLLLHINNLTGALPASLNNCKNLSTLILRVNSMSGELSTFNFSTLQRLTTLDLGNNNFSGHFPQSLYFCKSLTAVRFANNHLTGQISPKIVGLESLTFLSISNNFLTNATGVLKLMLSCPSWEKLKIFFSSCNLQITVLYS